MSKRTLLNEKEICEKYINGESTLTLGKEYRISYQSVRDILIRNNYQLRDHSEKTLNAIKQGRNSNSEKQRKSAKERWSGENNPRWRKIGDIKYDTQGYAIVKTEDGWKERSRITAEKILRRKLKKEEVIHHINKIKDDDNPKNLYLFKNGKEHRIYHLADNLHKKIKINHLLKSNLKLWQ